jgi:hypothetical protein
MIGFAHGSVKKKQSESHGTVYLSKKIIMTVSGQFFRIIPRKS